LEQPAQLGQVGGAAAGVQFDQELLTDGPKDPLDLAAALGLAGTRVGQADAEHRAGPLELAGDERRAVVDIQQLGHAPGRQRGARRGFQPEGVLGVGPAIADQRTGVVVDDPKQVGLAAGHAGAVEGVGGPQVVGTLGLEAAEDARGLAGGPAQAEPGEVALQRARMGLCPRVSTRILAICSAVRFGASRLSVAAASSSSAGVRGTPTRGSGTRAANPPARQARIQRSRVLRPTRTRCPSGPRWSRSASARTSAPRSRLDSTGSAASRISE
jgi:hypothetical protein